MIQTEERNVRWPRTPVRVAALVSHLQHIRRDDTSTLEEKERTDRRTDTGQMLYTLRYGRGQHLVN